MKFLFRQFLLLGVILGLAGQSVAYAASPCAAMQQEQTTAAKADCVMGQRKADKSLPPCKELSPGCLAMAGCAALIAIDSLTPTMKAPVMVANLDIWPATSVLNGRSIAPDPDPPSLFG